MNEYLPKFEYHYRAKILKIVDGDTVQLEIDLGLDSYRRIKCRLFGINAPESNTPEGKQAKAFLETLLPMGIQVRIDTIKNSQDQDKQEKYGRYLVSIYAPGVNATVQEILVNTNHAVYKTY